MSLGKLLFSGKNYKLMILKVLGKGRQLMERIHYNLIKLGPDKFVWNITE
jgi:hypothetical protein